LSVFPFTMPLSARAIIASYAHSTVLRSINLALISGTSALPVPGNVTPVLPVLFDLFPELPEPPPPPEPPELSEGLSAFFNAVLRSAALP